MCRPVILRICSNGPEDILQRHTNQLLQAFFKSYEVKMPDLFPEPYRIKMVEPIRMTDRNYRRKAIAQAGYNTFLLRSEDVYIDLLTDSGTNAMSDNQWAGMMRGDEAYAGSINFEHLAAAVQDVYGYRFVVPTHQGRAAEHIMSQLLIKPGDVVPGNMYFTTTKLHQEKAGGLFRDVIVDEAHDPQSTHKFKGNVCFSKLDALVKEAGADKIPYISLEGCVNMAGGQPFSLANLIELRKFCDGHGISIMLDATRVCENAMFIKLREAQYSDLSIKAIVRKIGTLTDGCTMSAKKDHLVNIGGFLAMNDEQFYTRAKAMVVEFEGLHTYGGMAGRDMEAVARGIYEAVEEAHLRHRIDQTRYLGEQLLAGGIPIVQPIGSHAVFLDARRFLPHLSQELFPAQALAAALYVESGVRAMERGIVSAGRNPRTGEHNRPRLELVRLTIPRRVYTQTHLDVVAEAVKALYDQRRHIKGLKMVFEPKQLRFFQAQFEPLSS